jgi:hypothetical protein
MPSRSDLPPPSRRAAGGPIARLVAALALVAMGVVIVYVVKYVRGGTGEGPRPVFDPATTDPDELRRVTEAVSRVIAAPPSSHEAAVETLETLRVQSAGARDLQEACVNTYRGTIRAEQMFHEGATMLSYPDGGELPRAEVSPALQTRAEQLLRQANEQIEIVNQSKDRCLDLYVEATRRMGIAPARRPGP